MRRRDLYHKLLAVGCIGAVLAMAGSAARQDPSYTISEYNAFVAQASAKNPQVKIKLLDDFSAKYPHSVLMPYVYETYYHLYFSIQNYPQTVAYVDKLLVLGDKIASAERLPALVTRARAYAADCNDSVFQTPEASAKAIDAAAQGQQLMTDLEAKVAASEQFAGVKIEQEEIFNSAAGIAASHLKGDPAVCVPVPTPPSPETLARERAADRARYDHLIQELRDEQRSSSESGSQSDGR